MEGEQPEKVVDLSAVKTADLVRELKARFVEIQKAQAELGMDTVAPVTSRPKTKLATEDLRKTKPKTLKWHQSQMERRLKSAQAKNPPDVGLIAKYQAKLKAL